MALKQLSKQLTAVVGAAPPALNWAGVGDLLSCYTALWDWEAAAERQGERFDEAVAQRTRALLQRLMAPGMVW